MTITKVLIVEDDPHTRLGLTEVLRGEGFDVVAAADGPQAVTLFDEHQPDLICLDVMLPGISGYDLCRRFRATRPRVPILFITAKSEEIDRVVGLELGGDDYIVKPFGIREVMARIRAVLRRVQPDESAATVDEPSFALGDLQVFPRQLRARRGEQVLELSPREMQLLEVFHRHRGAVLTRAELFQQIWGYHYCPNSRTLDQTISQLRRRIEIDPRHPLIIKTAHGAGYRYDG